MASYQIELSPETEQLLQNLVQQTDLSVNELVTQGLLVLEGNVELIVQKPKARFFDIYSQLDIGEKSNCVYPANEAKSGVKTILQNKLTR